MDTIFEPGEDFPRSRAELEEWFATEEDCLAFLDELRWGDGFECPGCGHTERWTMADGTSVCTSCEKQTSITAGTIFEKTRTSLRTWFRAAWLITSQKDGVSALGLQRVLEIGSYRTAWTMLHRYRRAMIRPGRSKLSGHVEVDETFLRGDRAAEKREGKPPGDIEEVWVAVAVEITPGEPQMGRIRLASIPDRSEDSVVGFVRDHVAGMSTIYTDAWSSYSTLTEWLYPHEPMNLSDSPWLATDIMPAVHRVASLLKRWLLGTHQGGVREQLQPHLDEFVFRFNRRTSRHRGHLFYRLLQYAVQTPPATYDDITTES